MRYKFYVHDNEVICVSRYAGKNVKAVAKCSPLDTFDLEKGKEIARLRVDHKVAEKRAAALIKKQADITAQIEQLYKQFNKVEQWLVDTDLEIIGIETQLACLK